MNKLRAFSEAGVYCEENGFLSGSKLTVSKQCNWIETKTIVTPDNSDNDIENFFRTQGIVFKKYPTERILNTDAVIKRVAMPNEGYKTVLTDPQKLDKILSAKLESNFEHCKSDYNKKYIKNEMNFILKSGQDDIQASTLKIKSDCITDDESLTPVISIDFEEVFYNNNHCMYFAMQDAGMKKIPVYVDEESYRLGSALGIFTE